MKTIQIRHVPDDIHHLLREQALEAGLSLSDLVLRELTVIARRPPLAEVLDRATARPGGTTTAAVVDAVAPLRGRR